LERRYDRDDWWKKSKFLRTFFMPELYLTSLGYRKWRFTQKSLEERKKILKVQMERLKRKGFSLELPEIVGREKEIATIMRSVQYYVFKDPEVRKFSILPPPKIFLLTGPSGSGKSAILTFLRKKAVLDGLEYGVLPLTSIVSMSQIYSKWYGSSASQTEALFNKVMVEGGILAFDEAHILSPVRHPDSNVDREDQRVMSAFVMKLDEVINSADVPAIVAFMTNREDELTSELRRRIQKTIDINVTGEILREVAKKQEEKFRFGLDPLAVLAVLEREVYAMGQPMLTPADVVEAYRGIYFERVEPKAEARARYQVTLDDFKKIAPRVKLYARENISKSAKQAVIITRPTETYADVGGLKDVAPDIIKEISASLDENLIRESGYVPPKGILLVGPPGTGKTLLVKAIANETGATFLEVKIGEIIKGYYGEPEKTLKDIFNEARFHAPAIVFIDEIDALALTRGSADLTTYRFVNTLITELDGFTPLNRVMVIGTTNLPQVIDRSVLQRFTKWYDFSPPKTLEDKKDVLKIHLKRIQEHLDEECTLDNLVQLIADRTIPPRVIADTFVRGANEYRVKELQLLVKLGESNPDMAVLQTVYTKEFQRLKEIYGLSDVQLAEKASELCEKHRVKLYHFRKSVQDIDTSDLKMIKEIQYKKMVSEPVVGQVVGIGYLDDVKASSGTLTFIKTSLIGKSEGELGNLTITGNVGESVREAVENAVTAVSNRHDANLRRKFDIVVQFESPFEGGTDPTGKRFVAIDGGSIGLATAVALNSAYEKTPVPQKYAFTGKISIYGEVGEVGGITEGKLSAVLSLQDKCQNVVLPGINYEQFQPDELKPFTDRGLKIMPVKNLHEAIELVKKSASPEVESK